MSALELEDIDITGIDELPADESVKLNGPPGTGKTTECAARVATLLSEGDYTLDDVLWATYRKSLAMDTIDRLNEWGIIPDRELSDPGQGPTKYIATTHAIANRLVGGIGDIVNYGDRKPFARERNLRYDKRQAWDEPPGQLLFGVFDYAANNLLDLHDEDDRQKIPMLPDLKKEYPGSVARAWDDWQDYKAQENKFDFWEQLVAPLKDDVAISRDIVVIDEYHDATPLMAKLSEYWIEQAEIAIVAGDPLQVVNTYAGARPKFFNRLDLPEILLNTTHRVPEENWAVATHVLGEAHDVPPVRRKKSGSFHSGKSPRFTHSGENGWNVPGPDDRLSPPDLVNEYGEDTMFLTRTQRQAEGVARSLEKAGVLFETQSSMDVSGWGARDEMAERTALYNALQRLEDVQPASGGGLSAFTDRPEKTPEEVRLRHREAAALLDHTNHEYLAESRATITEAAEQMVEEEAVVKGSRMAALVTDSFWGVYSRGAGAVRHLNRTANTMTGSKIDERDEEAMKAALKRNDEPVLSVDTKVYTIHASKGTEARTVVVYDGITGTIETAIENNDREFKNEHRTWYVALTRADANTIVLRDGFEWANEFLPRTLVKKAQEAHKQGVNA